MADASLAPEAARPETLCDLLRQHLSLGAYQMPGDTLPCEQSARVLERKLLAYFAALTPAATLDAAARAAQAQLGYPPHNEVSLLYWKDVAGIMAPIIVAESEGLREVLEEVREAWAEEGYEIEQVLGKALGYPWYKDDLKNFPDATEADGVCVGDHTVVSLVAMAADRIERDAG